MTQRCLVIADDLTGGADAGAQFSKNGLATLLVSLDTRSPVQFSTFDPFDVLVVNIDSRGASPEQARRSISGLFENYDPSLFPVIYKKIDSTLRGNVGDELDALILETKDPLCFMTPAYPEQGRTVVDGILMIGGKPLASTEFSREAAFPVKESHICKLLNLQSLNPIGWIGLKEVASGEERLKSRVEEENKKGNRIIVFDAVSRQDLANIADVAFRMEWRPLLAGSAGLAREVARKLSSSASRFLPSSRRGTNPLEHVLIVSGSASRVTHQQLRQVGGQNIPLFVLPPKWVIHDDSTSEIEKEDFSKKIARSLAEGSALIQAPQEFIPKERTALPVPINITETLASLALSALEGSGRKADDLALVLTGGETAMGVIRLLQGDGIEIEDELLEGIMKGHLKGGRWDGLTIVTKAGGFGKEDALKKIVEILENPNCQDEGA